TFGPGILIIDLSGRSFRLGAVGNRQGDGRSYLDVEYTLISVDAGSPAATKIAAQIDNLNPVEASAHHRAQAGIGPAGQELAIGDEGNDTPAWRIFGLEQLPDCPTPEGDG